MENYTFQKAVPVWEAGSGTVMNRWLQFRTEAKGGQPVVLALTGSSAYVVKVNGVFAAFGPARSAHGFYRVDELPLTALCDREKNVITVTVMGYNCTSFYHLCQPSFLCAELICGGEVTAFTNGEGFTARLMTEHEEKVERFSFQRPFVEVYNLDSSYQAFETEADVSDVPTVTLIPTEKRRFIKRGSHLNTYGHIPVKKLVRRGSFDFRAPDYDMRYQRHILNISEKMTGFRLDELSTNSLVEAASVQTRQMETLDLPEDGANLADGEFAVFEMERNTTGQVELNVSCDRDVKVLVTYGELLEKEGSEPVDFRHAGTVCVTVWRLKKGEYRLSTIEPYTGMYIKVAAVGGNVKVSRLGMNYFGADEPRKEYAGNDPVLKEIFDAAVATYRQNTFTIFMDCPSRERAGWLCDSFFTSRTEWTLTGKSEVERVFLENFLLPEKFRWIPEGMLPMCYPADTPDGNFIPNWAMWYVIELDEYFGRTGDQELIDRARDRVYGLLSYFKPFENEYGLLEKLKKWVFVEWSRSNDLVQDVSFPSNMLYARMLQSAAQLYGDVALLEKSERIHKAINDLAFMGTFYCDNAIRGEDGKLKISGEATESCQYYAFFCGTATFESRPELWQILLNDFGPERIADWPHFREDAKWKEVSPSNAFIGDFLRLELIFRSGEREKLIENIKGFFRKMAETTGTLWENETSNASCNHGFASHVLYWMDGLGMIKDA